MLLGLGMVRGPSSIPLPDAGIISGSEQRRPPTGCGGFQSRTGLRLIAAGMADHVDGGGFEGGVNLLVGS